jgi:hypothetical protein
MRLKLNKEETEVAISGGAWAGAVALIAWGSGAGWIFLAIGVLMLLAAWAAYMAAPPGPAAPEDRPPSSLLNYEPDSPGRYRRHADAALHRGREVQPGPTLDDPDRGRITSVPILDSSDPAGS